MNKIEEYRNLSGKSRAQLAEEVGISVSYVYRIEKNERIPTVKIAQRLAAQLETPLDVLFPN